MGQLTAGDRLIVSELSRLGRSIGKFVELLDAISTPSGTALNSLLLLYSRIV